MHWTKQGLIFCPNDDAEWMHNTALTPTPILHSNDTIRIYAAFRDAVGRARIGFIDVDATNPSRIRRISKRPVLDLGRPGCFDDNGVILGDVIAVDGLIYMYYVGFQIPMNVKFLAFSGLAVSQDQGETFTRTKETPILDRANKSLYIRAIHSVLKENNRFRIWYSCGSAWENINTIKYPKYEIYYTESSDGVSFPNNDGHLVLSCDSHEYRIGRPRVAHCEDGFKMRFTSDTYNKLYSCGVARSPDGIKWHRTIEQSIPLSRRGWDSSQISYQTELSTEFGDYLFYCGNDMGRGGVGYAKLTR